jgi:hypothetical protein
LPFKKLFNSTSFKKAEKSPFSPTLDFKVKKAEELLSGAFILRNAN